MPVAKKQPVKKDFTLSDLREQREYEADVRRREDQLAAGDTRNRDTTMALLRYAENKQLNYERKKRGLAPVDQRGNVTGPAPGAAKPVAKKTVAAPPPAAAAAAPVAPVAAPVAAAAVPEPVAAAPVAVTDPASQISPEEQAARLRARLLLSQGTGRGNRFAGLNSSQLGYRMLSGGAAA